MVTSTLGNAFGISSKTVGLGNPLGIANSGDVTVSGYALAEGIYAITFSGQSPISIVNSGDFSVTAT